MTGVLRRHQQDGTLAVAGVVLLAFVLPPLAALSPELVSGWTHAADVLSGARPFVLLLRSLALSAAVTVLSLVAGISLGALIGRTDVRGKTPSFLLHAFPAFVPPFVVALGWFHLLGTRGLAGSEATARLLFSEVGVVFVLALTFTPIATALVAVGLRGVDPSLEEAGRTVAGPVRVFARILLPAAAPAIALSALVVFTLAFSELGVPMFLRVDVFPAAVFARLGGIDYAPGEAVALVLPLLPVALALWAFERRFLGARSFAVLGLRAAGRAAVPLGRWRWLATLALALAGALAGAPIAALAWRALSAGGFAEVGPWLGRAPWNSLFAGALAATIIVAVGFVVGHAVARRVRGASFLDAVATLSFLAPAAVLGVGLIATWNRPAFRWVYGSAAILVVGYVARYAVIGVRVVATLVSQTPVHLEEAAASAGAGFLRRLVRVLLPLHRGGLAFAWLLALVFCLRDLELPVLYYPPGGEPATVRLFTLEANGPEPVVAALATVHVGMTALVLLAGSLLLRARRSA